MEEKLLPLRVLIVDDTVIYRKIFGEILSTLPGIELVGKAPNGVLALKKMEQGPVDVVFLDVFMPEMDGIETLQNILQNFPLAHVIMVSAQAEEDADIVIKALKLGALDFIAKPQGKDANENWNYLTEEFKKVIQIIRDNPDTLLLHKKTRFPFSIRKSPLITPSITSRSEVSSHGETISVVEPPPKEKATTILPKKLDVDLSQKRFKKGNFNLIVMGISTGGPNSLNSVIPMISGDIGCPILLVQHMPKKFTATLAEHLQLQSQLKVREAKDHEIIMPNTVLIAPGGYHMVIRRNPFAKGTFQVNINEDPPVHSCRPSVDVLFNSVAQNWEDGNVLSIIMTGMGEDGAAGVAALKEKGICYSLAQDEETSVVYGMPKAVVDRKLADEVLPLDQISVKINMLFQRK